MAITTGMNTGQEQPILEVVRELKKRLLDLRNDMDKFVNAPVDVEPENKPTSYLSPLNEIIDCLRCCHSIVGDIQTEFVRDIRVKISGHALEGGDESSARR